MTAITAKRLFVFVLCAVLLDATFGGVLARLYPRTLTGEQGGLTNLALTKGVDVLVLGSSRAQNHVMPSVLSARLGSSVYNAGLKGHDLLYASMVMDLWKKRHPRFRAVVLNFDLETMLERPREIARAQLLAPYLDESQRVRDILIGDDPIERFMFLSRSYRYNGKVFSIAKNLFVHPNPAYDGYMNVPGAFEVDEAHSRHGMLEIPIGVIPTDSAAVARAREPYWVLKSRLLAALAEDVHAAGAKLFLVHSPIWALPEEAHAIWAERTRQLASSLPSTEFIDICQFSAPEQFAGRIDLLRDAAHLNERGARIFSTLLADELEKRLPPP